MPTSFVPNEDQGYAMAAIIMPQAASLSRTQAIAEQGRRDLQETSRAWQTRTVVTGYSLLDSGFKTNAGTIFVTFTDFDKRYENIDTAKQQNARAILAGFYAKAREIEGAIVVPIAPPAIPGIGTTGGFEFWIQDTGTGDPVALDGVHAGLPQEGARAAGAHRARHDLLRVARSSCAPTSTATRRSCSAFRSRTSTARSRRSSAR